MTNSSIKSRRISDTLTIQYGVGSCNEQPAEIDEFRKQYLVATNKCYVWFYSDEHKSWFKTTYKSTADFIAELLDCKTVDKMIDHLYNSIHTTSIVYHKR